MRYVVDTNVVSETMKGNPTVLSHMKRVGRQNIVLPQPVLAEISYGLARLPRSKRRVELTSRFSKIAREFTRAPWTDEVSFAFGLLKATLERSGERIEDFDAAIAAHAVALDGVLVTANAKHMSRVPQLTIEDWATRE